MILKQSNEQPSGVGPVSSQHYRHYPPRYIANFNESTSATTVTNHRTYNSYGKLVSETNAAVDLIFGYTGKQLDEATGLQHNLFRWYDAGLGQWLSEDPMGFAAGDENVRRYVSGRLLSGMDSTGLMNDNDPCYGSLDDLADRSAVLAIQAPYVEFAGLTVLCMAVEPLDYAVSAYQVYQDPGNGLNYLGFIPLVPATTGQMLAGLGGVAVAGAKLIGDLSSTKRLADAAEAIAKVGPPPRAQTVNVMNTSGGVIVAGQIDLIDNQKLLAEKLGIMITPDDPGVHAELTNFLYAAQNGWVCFDGALTNGMCDDCVKAFESVGYQVIFKDNLKKEFTLKFIGITPK